MKIGYLQFNNPVELCLERVGSVLGTDIRLGILESMVGQGHEVTILSPIKNSHLMMLDPEKRKLAVQSHIDYSFIDKLKYEPVKDRDLDLDFLFIQYGPTNTLFAYNAINEDYRQLYANRTPYMHRTMAVVEGFSGPVVYYQNDHLPIPLGEVEYGLSPGRDSHNLRNVMGRWHPWQDKSWMILTTSFDIVRFKTENSSTRYRYHYKPFKFKYIPLLYSENVFPARTPSEDPLFDLLYVGAQGDKFRNERLSKMFGYSDGSHRKAILGEWDPAEFDKWFMGKGVELVPPVHQSDVCNMLNETYCSLQVLKKNFHSFGMMTMRAIEVIRSGSILIMDGMIPGYRDYVDDEWAAISNNTVYKTVERVKGLSYDERCRLVRSQNQKLNTWNSFNWDDLVKEVVA